MRKLTLAAAAALMFAGSAFAQGPAAIGLVVERQSQAATVTIANKQASDGMVWYHLQNIVKHLAELEKQVPERDHLVAALDQEVKDGDKNLVRLYLRRLITAEGDLLFMCDRLEADLKKFDESAGNALENNNSFSLEGYISEKDYRNALKIVRRAQELVKSRYLNADQMKVWDAALKTPGLDSQYFKIPQPPVQTTKK
jgi:hypothetical protein